MPAVAGPSPAQLAASSAPAASSSTSQAPRPPLDRLLQTVRKQGPAEVEALIAAGEDVRKLHTRLGQNLVFFAAARPGPEDGPTRLALLRLLVERLGLEAAHVDRIRQTALFYAAREGNLEACEFLIERRCDADALDQNKWTPLFFAAKHGQEACVRLLLERRSQAHHADAQGRGAVHYTASSACAALLVRTVEPKDASAQLDFAVRTVSVEAAVVRRLVAAGAKPPPCLGGQNLVFVAAARTSAAREVCEILVGARVEPDALSDHRQTPLFFAVRKQELGAGGLEAAEFLVQHRCDPGHADARGETPLFYAAQRADALCAQFLLDARASPHHTSHVGQTAMFYAAFAGAVDCMRLLLERLADATVEAKQGNTALFLAANAECVGLLLEHRCSLHHRNGGGLTPLVYAAELGREDAVAAMLDRGARVLDADNNGRTALDRVPAERNPRLHQMLRDRLAAARGQADVGMQVPVGAASKPMKPSLKVAMKQPATLASRVKRRFLQRPRPSEQRLRGQPEGQGGVRREPRPELDPAGPAEPGSLAAMKGVVLALAGEKPRLRRRLHRLVFYGPEGNLLEPGGEAHQAALRALLARHPELDAAAVANGGAAA